MRIRQTHTFMLGLLWLSLSVVAGCSRPASGDHEGNQPANSRERRIFRDVPYAAVSGQQRADVYLPHAGEGPFPAIMFIHGGGYIDGDKTALLPGLVSLANRRGFAVVSIGYRLLPEADFPAQIHDVKAAIRWLRASADTYRIDPDAIVLWGVSAGGHLAALAGTSEGVQLLQDDTLGYEDQPARVAAVVDWFGPADFIALRDYLEEQRRSTGGAMTLPLDYITHRIDDSPELVKAADPATHADAHDPPILIQHGDADAVVPVEQSLALARTLTERMGEAKVTLDIQPNEGHGTGVFIATDTLALTLDWIEERLE